MCKNRFIISEKSQVQQTNPLSLSFNQNINLDCLKNKKSAYVLKIKSNICFYLFITCVFISSVILNTLF